MNKDKIFKGKRLVNSPVAYKRGSKKSLCSAAASPSTSFLPRYSLPP